MITPIAFFGLFDIIADGLDVTAKGVNLTSESSLQNL